MGSSGGQADSTSTARRHVVTITTLLATARMHAGMSGGRAFIVEEPANGDGSADDDAHPRRPSSSSSRMGTSPMLTIVWQIPIRPQRG
jgi:hypothetical protein